MLQHQRRVPRDKDGTSRTRARQPPPAVAMAAVTSRMRTVNKRCIWLHAILLELLAGQLDESRSANRASFARLIRCAVMRSRYSSLTAANDDNSERPRVVCVADAHRQVDRLPRLAPESRSDEITDDGAGERARQ